MWDVLKDYPAARVRLEAVAAKKIERYKKVPLEKGRLLCTYTLRKGSSNLPRQKSVCSHSRLLDYPPFLNSSEVSKCPQVVISPEKTNSRLLPR